MENEKTRKQIIKEWLGALYVPTASKSRYDALIDWLRNYANIRSINSNDSYKSRYLVLSIETKGNAPWTAFREWRILSVDFGEIKGNYAMAYIRDEKSENGEPKRINISSPQYSIII